MIFYLLIGSMHLAIFLTEGNMAHGMLAGVSGSLGVLLLVTQPLMRLMGWIVLVGIALAIGLQVPMPGYLYGIPGLPTILAIVYFSAAWLLLYDSYQWQTRGSNQ